jgi:transglutaminase-like putative cysteine protease
MLRTLKLMAVALAMVCVAEPAIAQFKPGNRAPIILLRKRVPPYINPNLNLLPELGISPSQAAAIAKADYPGSKVLKVKLRGDVYAVTLRTDSSVVKVFISGVDGSVL